jgi:hypothetical protein
MEKERRKRLKQDMAGRKGSGRLQAEQVCVCVCVCVCHEHVEVIETAFVCMFKSVAHERVFLNAKTNVISMFFINPAQVQLKTRTPAHTRRTEMSPWLWLKKRERDFFHLLDLFGMLNFTFHVFSLFFFAFFFVIFFHFSTCIFHFSTCILHFSFIFSISDHRSLHLFASFFLFFCFVFESSEKF